MPTKTARRPFSGAVILHKPVKGIVLGLVLCTLLQPVYSAELSPMRALNSYHANDNFNANDQSPAIASDGNGRMLAVWFYTENDSARDGELTLCSSSSTTSGTAWTPTVRAQLNDIINKKPELCYAGQDKWIVVLTTGEEPNQATNLAISTDDMGQTWSDPVELPFANPTANSSYGPELDSDGAGNLLAVWAESSHGEANRYTYLIHSTDFGQTWSAPQELTLSSQAGMGREKLAYAGAGKWLMLYRVELGVQASPIYGPLTEFRIASSTDLGANWTEVGPVFSNDVMPWAVMLDLKVAGNQAVIVADLPVFPDSYDPEVVLGGDSPNVGTVVWTSNDSGTTFTGPMWLRGPAPLETEFDHYGNPVVVSGDGHGNWVATVNDDPNPVWYSSDIDTTWTLSQNLGYFPDLPSIAAAGQADFAILTSYQEDWNSLFGHDKDIRAFVSATGGGIWNEPIPVNSNASGDSSMVFDSDVDMAISDDIILSAWSADGNVMVSRSFDNGDTWGEAALVPESSGAYRPRVEWTGALDFSVYWMQPGLPQAVYKTDTVDGGHTWSDPQSVWFERIFNPLPLVFWHTSLNKTEVQTATGETVRVRSVTASGENNEFTINTYLDASNDNGETWTERALVNSQTRLDSGNTAGNVIAGEPAILDLGQGQLAVLISNSWIGFPDAQTPPRLSHWDLLLAESVDNGQTWSNGISVYSGNDGVQFGASPTPAAAEPLFRAADDRIIMAWTLATEYDLNRVNDTDIVYRTRRFGVNTAASDWQLYD